MDQEELPAAIYSAAALGGVACMSSIALSIHRRLHHETQFGNAPSPLKYDKIRDYTVPFADNTRLSRIFFDTLLMTAMSIYNLIYIGMHFVKGDKMMIYEIISTSLLCIAWIYILALTVVSRRYKLPNKWGFILNVHLFVYYMTSLFVSLYCLWNAFRIHHSQLSLSEGLPLILAILFSFDLFYTTGSIEQGPPFLDTHGDNGKEGEPVPVAGVTVASIFSFLYFNWGTDIVMAVYKNAKDVHLPSLPPLYRGYNLFYIFGSERDRSLIHRLIHANLPAILLQSGMTAISAALYYAPAFFLNKFLNLISDIDAGKPDEFYMVKGIIIVSALAMSLMVLSIVVGQLYYWGNIIIITNSFH